MACKVALLDSQDTARDYGKIMALLGPTGCGGHLFAVGQAPKGSRAHYTETGCLKRRHNKLVEAHDNGVYRGCVVAPSFRRHNAPNHPFPVALPFGLLKLQPAITI